MVDLFDSNSISNSSLDIEVVLIDPTIIDITFVPTQVGDWTISVSTGGYDSTFTTTTVTVNCTSSFLADFRNLDLNATRPNLKKVSGRPITSKNRIFTSRFKLNTPLSVIKLCKVSIKY